MKSVMQSSITFSRSSKFCSHIYDYLNYIFPFVLTNIIMSYCHISLTWTFNKTYAMPLKCDYSCKISIVKNAKELFFTDSSGSVVNPYCSGNTKIFFDYPYIYLKYLISFEKIDCRNNSREHIFVQTTDVVRNLFMNSVVCIKNNVIYTGNFVCAEKIGLISGQNSNYSVKIINIYVNTFTKNVTHQLEYYNIFYDTFFVDDIKIDDVGNITVCADFKNYFVLIVFNKFMNVLYKRIFCYDVSSCISFAKILYSNRNEILYTFILFTNGIHKTMLCYAETESGEYQEFVFKNKIMINYVNHMLFIRKYGEKVCDVYES